MIETRRVVENRRDNFLFRVLAIDYAKIDLLDRPDSRGSEKSLLLVKIFGQLLSATSRFRYLTLLNRAAMLARAMGSLAWADAEVA